MAPEGGGLATGKGGECTPQEDRVPLVNCPLWDSVTQCQRREAGKGTVVKFKAETDKLYLNQVMRANISSDTRWHSLLDTMQWEGLCTSAIFLPQTCNLSLFTGKTTDVPWLLTTRKIPLKIVKVMHNKFTSGTVTEWRRPGRRDSLAQLVHWTASQKRRRI